jgi:type IV secretion system protein VirD4
MLIASIVVAGEIATQYLAHAWQNAPALGVPLCIPTHTAMYMARTVSWGTPALTIVLIIRHPHWTHRSWTWSVVSAGISGTAYTVSLGPVYSPLQGLGWMMRYRHVSEAAITLHHAEWIFALSLCVTVILSFVIMHPSARDTPSTSHGSARWNTGNALHHEHGLLLGYEGAHTLRYQGDGHLVTVAPTRSGKGVSVIIPNLLTYPGSVVVTDPKAENYAVTARRRAELGTTVHAFDPFDVVGGTATFNPLAVIDPDSLDAIDDARLLADMLVVVEGKETGEQAFWNEEARALLAGLILYVVAHEPPERRTLPHVRTLLTLAPTLWDEVLARMSRSTAVRGMVARAATRVLQKAEKERSGVISSAQSHTHFLDSPRMTRVLHQSTVELTALKREPMSLFLILPPDRLDTYQRWLRLMIASQLVSIMRTPGRPTHSVVFFLDEFAHLGRMQPVARDIALVGGYGATFWIFLQDLSQLRAIYAEQWPTFLANADVLQTFGTNDWDTAEYVSKMTGDATVQAASENASRGTSFGKHGSRQTGVSVTHAERGRRLLTPDEVRCLVPTYQLLFCKHTNPILARKECYYTAPQYTGQYDPNPLLSTTR